MLVPMKQFKGKHLAIINKFVSSGISAKLMGYCQVVLKSTGGTEPLSAGEHSTEKVNLELR